VLRARADVAPATRQRVRAVLDRLGFPPESVAARAAKVNGGLLDVLVQHVDSPRAGALLAGLVTQLGEQGISVVISAVQSGTSRLVPRRRWLDRIAARGTCGVLGIMIDFSESQIDYLTAYNIATLAIDPPALVREPLIAIRSDDRAATHRLTTHLLGLGHRRMAMLTGEHDTVADRERIAGFRDAMTAAHLPISADHIVAASTVDESANVTAHLLRLAERPTALLLAGEHGPPGAHRAATAAGYRIPEDVLLVGFDDLPIAATQVPGLSIVHRPVDTVVRTAASIIATSQLSSIAAAGQPAYDIAPRDQELSTGLAGARLLRSPDVILCGGPVAGGSRR
jgi:DNA-binding LacI/PurR family transcriptional regulator